jgi:tetratricopeptide (TPR) repeat protein
MGHKEEAKAANKRAREMFEALVEQFPAAPEYRFQLVETHIMVDPWEEDPSSLPQTEKHLRQAQTLIDQLTAESPEKTVYIQAQVHVHAKLGATLQRLKHHDEAIECYRRAIAFGGELIDRLPENVRARIDRSLVREALARLLVEQGKSDQARTLLDGAAEDLLHLAAANATRQTKVFILPDRFESLADAFTAIGETERAAELMGRVEAARTERPNDSAGPPP